MLSQLEKRSTYNVASGVLTKTEKILILFLCRLFSLFCASSDILDGLSINFQTAKHTMAAISVYEDFMRYAPGVGVLQAA